ncbi:MAG: metal-sulfur cluster assembly factor [Acidobacteria bacterium]|nr:metal-sulfur cluster assembly factor [Acidobacteriota bacterium]
MTTENTPPNAAPQDNAPVTAQRVLDALAPVQDPELRLGVVELGLVYDVLVDDSQAVTIKMTLTTPACPYGPMLLSAVHEVASELPGVRDVKIDLVWDPPWDPTVMASDEVKERLGLW